jgi:hypothetical protein
MYFFMYIAQQVYVHVLQRVFSLISIAHFYDSHSVSIHYHTCTEYLVSIVIQRTPNSNYMHMITFMMFYENEMVSRVYICVHFDARSK